MKHRLLLLLLLSVLTASMTGWAQNTTTPSYTIKGVLLDSLTQEGELYATIKIVKKDAPNKPVKMAVTNMQGKFQEKLNVAAGKYVITISSMGKATIVREFSLNPSTKVVDLGTMLSREASNELKGVEIVAQKPLVKVDVDKIAYNVEDDPDSKSKNVLEMLRKVPLVTVDGEDNVQVNGSSSFKIHVNGKPNSMMSNNPKEVLKSMPASSIKHIEVITSPGAKYDAEGIGGILNIVTVGSGLEGYTATFNTSGNNNGVGAGTYATLKKDKFTISVNYNYNYHNSPRGYSDNYRENYDSETEKYLQSTSSSKSTGKFQHGNVEASYEIDTLRLLTVAFGMYGGGNESMGGGETVMYGLDREKVAYRYLADNNGKGSWYSINGNIDYQRTSKKNKERMITFSYKMDTEPRTDNSHNIYTDIDAGSGQVDELIQRLQLRNYRSNGEMNTMEQTFQSDYTTPIGKLHTLEAGLKYIFRQNASDNKMFEASGGSDEYAYNERRSSEYRHYNHILSAYAGYTLKYKEFSFKPGVRYEQTIQEVKYIVGPGDNFQSNFSDVIPSVALGMKVGKTQSLRGSYSMRIWRPGIWNLNPYFDNQNPMAISQGNPNLKSEKSHAFDLAYSSFTSKFNVNVSVRYSFNNNGIERFSRLIGEGGETFGDNGEYTAPEGALYSTYSNMGKSQNTVMSLYLNWNASPKTRIYVNGRGGYNDLKSKAQKLHNSGWNGSCHAGVQHTFPLNIRLSLNAGGSTPYISLQGKGTGYSYYGLGLSRSFLKEDRLSLELYCNNMFEQYKTYSNHTEGANFVSKSLSKYPNRYYGVSIRYRIGELKASVKRAARSISNDDVKGGGGGGNGGGE